SRVCGLGGIGRKLKPIAIDRRGGHGGGELVANVCLAGGFTSNAVNGVIPDLCLHQVLDGTIVAKAAERWFTNADGRNLCIRRILDVHVHLISDRTGVCLGACCAPLSSSAIVRGARRSCGG